MTREIKESDARPWIRRVRAIATYIVLVYIGLLVILFTAQGYLIFVPSTEVFVPPEYAAWNMQDVELTVGEKSTHGWFVPANGDSRGAVLFSHGNAGNISHRVESIRIFRNLGLDTFIYDYGGYGKSTGSPSEQRCYADIRAAWRYLTESHGIPADQIILFGRSLGGGPTAQLATEVEAAAVILESTYTSIPDMARQQFPIFPVRLLARHRFDTQSKITDINVPILHIHSPDDDVIPYTHGQRLFETSTEPKTFLEISGDHNSAYFLSEPKYSEGLDDFLSRVTSLRSSADPP